MEVEVLGLVAKKEWVAWLGQIRYRTTWSRGS